MARIAFPDGRWLDIDPMWVDDELAIADLADTEGDFKAQVAFLRGMRDIIQNRTTATSWGGSVGQMSKDDLMSVFVQWRTATEDDALPPDNGPSSETP